MKDIAEIISGLTLFQKAALLSGANTWQSRSLPEAGIPPLWFADGPHGLRKQMGSADHLGINGSVPATCFPTAATIANSWNEELAGEIGAAIGAEAREQEVQVVLGPGLNIKRSPLGGRNFEYFSEDPELAGRLAAAYVRGLQAQGVAASPKHFAVNSQELRRMVSDSVIDERTLHEIYLTAFEIVVREAAPWTIMSSYNLINGTYAHEHYELLTTVLRDAWGFDGVVVSDWGGGNDPVAAVHAGGTLEMPSPGFDSAREIVAAVQSGTLAEAVLDTRVAELLALAGRVTASGTAPAVDHDAHHALARRAAAQSAVLLRNTDDLLPLAEGTSVALVGDFAFEPRMQGSGSSLVNPTRTTNLVDAVTASALTLAGTARGYRRDGAQDAALIAEAAALAARADVVVLALGLPESAESEGLDRSTLAVPANQIALLAAVAATNPRTVVLLSAGGAVELGWQSDAAALVHGYLGGQAGAEALVDVITGAVEPAGRLAETIPLSLADTPTAGRFPSTARTAEYREGAYVGYRYYDAAELEVAYPFGFGLGYTTFAFSDLTATPTGATVTVTNTGARRGTEIVQLYVRRVGAEGTDRSAQELKGFARVELDAGASTTVTISFGERTFRHYDATTSSWQTASGDYEIAVGRHSRDLAHRSTVTIAGTVPSAPAAPDTRTGRALRDLDDVVFAEALGRPVPSPSWSRGTLGVNDPIDSIRTARSRTARFAFRVIDKRRRKAESSGRPDLNMLFMLNAPFRVLWKMSGGLAGRELTEGVLAAVNGRTFRGLGRVIVAFFRGRRLEKAGAREFTHPTRPTEEVR